MADKLSPEAQEALTARAKVLRDTLFGRLPVWDHPEFTCAYCREKMPVNDDGNICEHSGCHGGTGTCPPLEADFSVDVEWERIQREFKP